MQIIRESYYSNDKILLAPMKGAAWHKVLLRDVAKMPRLGDF